MVLVGLYAYIVACKSEGQSTGSALDPKRGLVDTRTGMAKSQSHPSAYG